MHRHRVQYRFRLKSEGDAMNLRGCSGAGRGGDGDTENIRHGTQKNLTTISMCGIPPLKFPLRTLAKGEELDE